MTHEFRLADIGEGLEEAEIIEWRVQVGDHVRRDQPIVEVMTDKSNAELPAPVDGVVVALGGSIGDIVEVGSVLAVIDPILEASPEPRDADPRDDLGEAVPQSPTRQDTAPGHTASQATSPGDTASQDTSPDDGAREDAAIVSADPDDGFETPVISAPVSTFQEAAATTPPADQQYRRPQRPKASPTTRVEAARRGIDLSAVTGTGPGGRILLTDLDRVEAPDQPPTTAPVSAASPDEAVAIDDAPVIADPPPTTVEPMPIDTAPIDTARIDTAHSEIAPADGTPAGTPTTADPTAGDTATAEPGSLARPNDRAATEPLRGVRRAIARNMDRSWTTIPHIHSFQHIDAEPLLELRDRLRSSGRAEFESLTPLSFFVAAVANAIEQHPIANASLDLEAETITHHEAINIGVAVAAPQGLVVPVIRDVGDQSLAAVAGAVRSIVDGARSGSLPAEAFRDGTATITNFGSLGGEQALPLIRPPESVIFGFGSIAPRPFVIDDEVVARKTMHVVIATDHRLLDGDVTTALISRVGFLLENPINLVLGD